MKKTKEIIWGIVLLALAVGIIMYKLGVPGLGMLPMDISLWQILIGLVFAFTLINSIVDLSFGGILFSLAFLGIVFGEQLKIQALVPWTLLIVALIGTIALNLLFGNKGKKIMKKHVYRNHNGHREPIPETIGGDYINEDVSFTGATKYIHSNNFTGADLTCSFCGAEFYFDKAEIPSGTAVVNLDAKFCGVQMYVPREWNVVNEINCYFGAVDTDNVLSGSGTTTLILKGTISFGAVEISRV